MAKVLYGPIVSDARKKIGGVVATKGHAGNFMRKKVSPIQPRTTAQRNVRSSFSAHSKNWGTFSQTVIDGFNSLAKATPKKDRFGQTVTLTGLQLYQGLARNIDTVTGTPLTAAPANLNATTPGTLTVTATSGGSPALTVTPTNYPAVGESAAIFAAAQISAGRTFVGKQYRLLLVVPHSGSPAPYDILSAYTTKFGALVTLKKVPVLVKNINTTTGAAGQPSAALQAAT